MVIATDREIKVAKHKIAKRQRKRKDKHNDEDDAQDHMVRHVTVFFFSDPLKDELLSRGLDLNEFEKEVVKKSWAALTSKKFVDDTGITKSGIGKLFEYASALDRFLPLTETSTQDFLLRIQPERDFSKIPD